MPEVGGKHFPYTKKGRRAASRAAGRSHLGLINASKEADRKESKKTDFNKDAAMIRRRKALANRLRRRRSR